MDVEYSSAMLKEHASFLEKQQEERLGRDKLLQKVTGSFAIQQIR